jgi:integrase
MSLYKRGTVWWIRFTGPDGREHRETTRTSDKRQAQQLHDTRKADAWRQTQLGEQPRHTWPEAVQRWLAEHSERKGLNSVQSLLRQANQTLNPQFLDDISPDQLATLIHGYRATGVKNSTANNLLTLVGTVLNAAKGWGWLDAVPTLNKLPVTERRLRWLTRDDADRLLAELPAYLKPLVRFSLATGLRQQNAAQLEWNQLDLERRIAWIHADQAKGKRLITVPLNADAVVVLREQHGQHSRYVFVHDGQPILRPIAAGWYPAVKRAGLAGFRWHDLRHTWASWHVQAGTPLLVLKELGGWSNLDMVLRYAHLAPDHLAEHAERIAGPQRVRTNSSTAGQRAVVTT